MFVDELLKKAYHKHQQGKFEAAVKLYKEILSLKPDHLDANYLLGTLYAENNRLTEARHFLEKADNINPSSPYIKVNLGNICKVQSEFEPAREYYLQALELDKDLPQALFGLGTIVEKVDEDPSAAGDYYQKAITLSPNNPDMLFVAGKLLAKSRNELALDYFSRALALNPYLPDIHQYLGLALLNAKHHQKAAVHLKKALQKTPDSLMIRYFLCIAEGQNPDRELQCAYVRDEFDQYARDFEKSLTEQLGYDMPNQLVALLDEALGADVRFRSCVDLGCGTGLVGKAVRDRVALLTGIDISPEMLTIAAEKQCYDHLYTGEIVETLCSSSETYDLFVATDVIIYLGEVTELFAAIAAKAAPDALLVLSTETCQEDGYTLQETGRYAHNRNYIEAIATQNGGTLLDVKQIQLRKELNRWIMGELFLIKLK